MVPLIVAGLAAGALKTVGGLIGASKAKRDMAEAEASMPRYSRPDEVRQYLEMAKTNANGVMPGTTQLAQNSEQATQGALSNLQESGQYDAGSIQKLYQAQLGAYNNLAMKQAQYHDSKQQELSNALKESAKYTDQEFEYNVNAPWQRKMGNAINRYQSNFNMFQSGLGNMATAASNMTGGNKGYGGSTQASSTSTDSGGFVPTGVPQYGETQYMNG